VWTSETFVVPIVNPIAHWIERAALRGNKRPHPSTKYTELVLRFEVFDHNTFFKDLFTGQVSLSTQHIAKVLADGESESRVYPLQPKIPSGTMSISIARSVHIKANTTHILVKVDACKKLSRGDNFSGSHPYLAAFWDNQSLGESHF